MICRSVPARQSERRGPDRHHRRRLHCRAYYQLLAKSLLLPACGAGRGRHRRIWSSARRTGCRIRGTPSLHRALPKDAQITHRRSGRIPMFEAPRRVTDVRRLRRPLRDAAAQGHGLGVEHFLKFAAIVSRNPRWSATADLRRSAAPGPWSSTAPRPSDHALLQRVCALDHVRGVVSLRDAPARESTRRSTRSGLVDVGLPCWCWR